MGGLITFQIVGVKPGLLMNNPQGMAVPAEGKIGRKVIPTPNIEAEAKVYRLPSGLLYLTATMFRSSLLNAAVGQKINKKSAVSMLSGTLFTYDANEICTLYHPETGDPIRDYQIDTRRTVVQNQGIMRSRPCIPEWATELVFWYDVEALPPKMIRDVLEQAGQFKGIGDYRPEKKGPFGRFKVMDMQAHELN